jgi:cytochrome c-type biogenesis protein CcmF
LLPLLSEGFLGQEIGVGPAFFNRVNLPIGLGLLALTGIGPVIAWRRASRRNLRKAFLAPVAVGVLVSGGLALAGSREWMALATFGIAAFVLTVIVVEFWKGTKARARIEGEGFAAALYHLVMRNRRRWGGYIVHVGIVLVFSAFAGAAWNVRQEQTMVPGETAEITSPLGHTYTLTYEGMSPSQVNPNQAGSRNLLYQARALFSVSKDGEPLGTLGSEKRLYEKWESQLITEVGVRHAPLEDLYVILESAGLDLNAIFNDPNSPQRATFTFLVNPLVSFIWLGGLVLTLGGLIAMWPEPVRTRAASGRDEPKLEPAPVSAAAD